MKLRRWRISLVVSVSIVASAWLAGVIVRSSVGGTVRTVTPRASFQYVSAYGHQSKAQNVFFSAWLISAAVVLSILRVFLKPKEKTPFGDAEWASERDLRRAGLRATRGLLLGVKNGRYLMSDGFEHVICFAPTGSGKGVGIVIPNLLNWTDSAIVHDIKGENFNVTSGFRARHGQKVFYWNPGDPDGVTHCYNPLEFISPKPGQQIDDVQKIANLILPDQEFWSNEARTLFVGLVLYLLNQSSQPIMFGEVLRTIRGEGNFVEFVTRKLDELKDEMNPVAYMALNAFVQKAEKERSGVLSTLNSALELWANPLIDAATSRSDFDLRQLKKERTTIYVGVSPNNLHRLRPLLQIFYQQAIDFLTTKEPDRTEEPYGVLFLMDEFTSLGRMIQFEKGIAYFRSYRVRLLIIIQDTPQLETHYQRTGMNTFLGNAKIRLTFAANDLDTAELISKLLGTYGAPAESESRSRPMVLWNGQGSRSDSRHQAARPLLMAQEILQLPVDEEIVFVEAARPVKASKIRYYESAEFKSRLVGPISVPTIKPAVRRPNIAVSAVTVPERALTEDEIQTVLKG